MAKPAASFPRLFAEQPGTVRRSECDSLGSLEEMCQAFEQATGWPLRYLAGQPPRQESDLLWSAPVNPGVGTTPGHLRIDSCTAQPACSSPRAALEAAGRLGSVIADMLSTLRQTQHALWQREAELAAGVPLVWQRDADQHLAQRLEAVLKGGAEAVDCQAAALYLLDSGTTQLKLRSSWQLPPGRLTSPPRPLPQATADLKALAGHAVVVQEAACYAHWNLPEDFPAAVCVPVSSPTTPLGTLWMFSHQPRPFSDQQVNIIEIVGGRVAADLEREMLLAEAVEAARLKHQWAEAQQWQQWRLPQIAPLVDGWELTGWTEHANGVGGDFHDWFVRGDNMLVAAVGTCQAGGFESALAAGALGSALRAHGRYLNDCRELLEQVNHTLWSGSCGNQLASLFCAMFDPQQRTLQYAGAGRIRALLLNSDGYQPLVEPTTPLGLEPSTRYTKDQRTLLPGDTLVVLSEGASDLPDARGRPPAEAALAQALLPWLDASSDVLVQRVRQWLHSHAADASSHERTVLVAKCVV